jgi:hypothetical protein
MLHALGWRGRTNALRILVAETQGKRRLGRPRFWGTSKIKLNINQMYWSTIHVAKTGMDGILFGHGVEPSSSIGFMEFIEQLNIC